MVCVFFFVVFLIWVQTSIQSTNIAIARHHNSYQPLSGSFSMCVCFDGLEAYRHNCDIRNSYI